MIVFLDFRFHRIGMGGVRLVKVDKGMVGNEFVRLFVLEIDDICLGG